MDHFAKAVKRLDLFMQSQGLDFKPAEVKNLKGDAANSVFIERFKEVQRLKTQLEQYTDLSPENQTDIEKIMPEDDIRAFRGVYLELAQRLKEQQDSKGDKTPDEVQQLDFEFVLFASALIDYDYIMSLLARYTQAKPTGETKKTRDDLINLIASDAKFTEELDDIKA
ncbi:MAG: hypothetical protein R2880_11075, partial [Deinococcales bacterium]